MQPVLELLMERVVPINVMEVGDCLDKLWPLLEHIQLKGRLLRRLSNIRNWLGSTWQRRCAELIIRYQLGPWSLSQQMSSILYLQVEVRDGYYLMS